MADKKNFAGLMNLVRVMKSGLENNRQQLAGVGITSEKIAALNELYEKAERENNEQENLKAQLKTKTEELNKTIKELKSLHSDLKKRVKLEVPNAGWKEYGIDNKR